MDGGEMRRKGGEGSKNHPQVSVFLVWWTVVSFTEAKNMGWGPDLWQQSISEYHQWFSVRSFLVILFKFKLCSGTVTQGILHLDNFCLLEQTQNMLDDSTHPIYRECLTLSSSTPIAGSFFVYIIINCLLSSLDYKLFILFPVPNAVFVI